MSKHKGYSLIQIGLHWAVATLIVLAWMTRDGMGRVLRERIETGATGMEGNTTHVWLGGAAFALILVRIIVRLRSGDPGHADGTSPAMALAATWGHRLIYALMIATPALGAAAWYGGIKAAGDIHEYVGNALMIVALGHALAAMAHQAMGRDVLGRMINPRK